MAKYWKRINLKLAEIIPLRAGLASKRNKDFIEASILQAAIAEAALRIVITTKVGSRIKRFKKYWDGDASFSRLIDFLELLGGRKSLIERLRTYNASRNKIVHHIFEFTSIHDLVNEAKKNYSMGKRLTMQLFKEAGLSRVNHY